MLKVRAPSNLQNTVITDEPTCSKTISCDDKVKVADNLPSTSNFVATNNKDYYISYNYDKPVSDGPPHAFASGTISPSPSTSNTDEDGFKVPFPVKPTLPRISVRSDIRTPEQKPSPDFVNSSFKDFSIIDELFGISEYAAHSMDSAELYSESAHVDTKDNFLDSSISNLISRKPGRPRTKRTLKEDVPLSLRLKHRAYNAHRRKGRPRTVYTEESEEHCTTDEFPWTEEEKLNLYKGLKKFGHLDYALLKTCVPTRSENQVQQFVTYQSRLARSKTFYQKGKPKASFVAGRLGPHSRDVVVQFMQNAEQKKTPLFSQGKDYQFWTDLLTELQYSRLPDYLRERRDLYLNLHRRAALGHALYLIRDFERHPPVSDTGGVDIKAAYNFLWCCFTHQPLPRLNPTTRQFLTDQYDQLGFTSSLSLGLVEFMDSFKKKIAESCTQARESSTDKSSSQAEDVQNVDEEIEDEEKEVEEKEVEEKEDEEKEVDGEDSDGADESQEVGPVMTADEGIVVLDKAIPLKTRRQGLWRPLKMKKGRKGRTKYVVFRHGRDDTIPIPDPSIPSTLTHVLKNAVFNPLSIPVSTLKNEKR